jgi:hypothetical protein
MGTANSKSWKPGQSGNPAGRPLGSRNAIDGAFLTDLLAEYRIGGRDAIVAMRTNSPGDFVKMIASLLPKQVDIKHAVELVSDDDLLAVLDALGRNRPAGYEVN